MTQQVARMVIYHETQTAEIILSVCKIGQYVTAGTTSRMNLIVSDNDNIRELATTLNSYKHDDPGACLSLWIDGRRYKFDMSLWPAISDYLNDFFNYIDNGDCFFGDLIIDEDD